MSDSNWGEVARSRSAKVQGNTIAKAAGMAALALGGLTLGAVESSQSPVPSSQEIAQSPNILKPPPGTSAVSIVDTRLGPPPPIVRVPPSEAEVQEAKRSQAVSLWLEYEAINQEPIDQKQIKLAEFTRKHPDVIIEKGLMAAKSGLAVRRHPGPIDDTGTNVITKLKPGEHLANITVNHLDGINIGRINKNDPSDTLVVRIEENGKREIGYIPTIETEVIPPDVDPSQRPV